MDGFSECLRDIVLILAYPMNQATTFLPGIIADRWPGLAFWALLLVKLISTIC